MAELTSDEQRNLNLAQRVLGGSKNVILQYHILMHFSMREVYLVLSMLCACSVCVWSMLCVHPHTSRPLVTQPNVIRLPAASTGPGVQQKPHALYTGVHCSASNTSTRFTYHPGTNKHEAPAAEGQWAQPRALGVHRNTAARPFRPRCRGLTAPR